MRIPKFFTVISTVAIFGAGFLEAQSAPTRVFHMTPEQEAEARETLRSAPTNSQPAMTPAPAPMTETMPAPAMDHSSSSMDTQHEVQARVALRQDIQRTDGYGPIMPPTALNPDLESGARETLHQEEAEQKAKNVAAMKKQDMKYGTTPASAAAYPTVTPAPMDVGPAPSISGSKEQQLSALLDMYKADRISPAEYHQQRAKIMAEPN